MLLNYNQYNDDEEGEDKDINDQFGGLADNNTMRDLIENLKK